MTAFDILIFGVGLAFGVGLTITGEAELGALWLVVAALWLRIAALDGVLTDKYE